MSMRDDHSPDHIDASIDDVARSLTRGAPSVSLRAAVRARIGGRRQWGLLGWRLGLAAAAVVVAIVVGRAMFATLGESSVSRSTSVAERDVATPPVGPGPAAASSAMPGTTATRPRGATTTDRVAVLRPPPPVIVTPIDMRPLEEPPLQVEAIEVPTPLRAQLLEIDPLVFR
jgi:hypothetical protein